MKNNTGVLDALIAGEAFAIEGKNREEAQLESAKYVDVKIQSSFLTGYDHYQMIIVS